MKEGDKVQVWDEYSHQCLGWGTIVAVAYSAVSKEEIPLIRLETGKKIWGNRCFWIEEKQAIKIGIRLFQDIHREPENKNQKEKL